MPVAVAMPTRQQAQPDKDPLDTVLKGLQIAGGIFGIKEGLAKAEDLKAQRERQSKLDEQTAVASQYDIASKDVAARKAGFSLEKGEGGKVALTPIPGYRDEEKEGRTLANEKLQLEIDQIRKGGGTKGLDEMLKRLAVQEGLRKAEEVEPAKALAAGYARRIERADDIINKLYAGGFDRTSPMSAIEAKMPGFLQSTGMKSQDQAENNFLNAVLRRESGASISPSEREMGEVQYFPRGGDSPEIIAQKAENRAQVISSFKGEAGDRALKKIPLMSGPDINLKTAGGSNRLFNYLGQANAQPTAAAPSQDFSDRKAELEKQLQTLNIKQNGIKTLPKGK